MKFNLQTTKEVLVVIILGLIALTIFIGGNIWLLWYQNQQPASCNIAVAQLYGTLAYYSNEGGNASDTVDQTASEDIRHEIEVADTNPNIKAILLQVDSGGGDPVAAEDVSTALRNATKPTVAFIADQGDSGAYWAATGAQIIFASANSSLGDIGVTQSYLDQTKQDQQNGLTFVSLTAGQYKDMGNPDAPLTSAEKALLQRDLNITMQNFIGAVAQNRNLSVASVTAIANGSSMEGRMALQDGLIDKIGNIYDVESYLAGKIGGGIMLCN